jgi:hypothetical protein
MNKLQTVYIPNKRCKIIANLIILPNGTKITGDNRYVFTSEELKQLLEQYTNKIVQNATASIKSIWISNSENPYYKDEAIINKESITSQLQPFLNEIGL